MRRMFSTLAAAGVLLALAAPAASQNGHDLYQQALRKERAEGDLPGAIGLYRQVVATGDRALAAQALLRIGESYEKLGRAEAREAYQRLVRDYADQAEPARAARARLAALERPAPLAAPTVVAAAPAGLTARLIWEGPEPGIDVGGQPTPDGRYLTFVDWHSGDLAVREVATGSARRLTNTGYPEYALLSAISADGRQAAYLWALAPWRAQLRVIGMDGSGMRVLLDNAAGEIDYLVPHAWAPDATQILTSLWMTEGTARISWVDASDGSVRPVKSLGWRRPMMVSLSPDGRFIVYDAPAERDTTQRDIYLLAADGSFEIPLIEHPANDLHPIWGPDGEHVFFSSNRGGSVDLWAQRVVDGRPRDVPLLVQRDMAHNFFWPMGFTRAGAFFYAKETGGGDIYLAPFDAESGRVTGRPQRIVEVAVGYNHSPHLSSDGKRLVFGTRRAAMSLGHGANLVIHDLQSGRQLEPARELILHRKRSRPRWSPDGAYILVDARLRHRGLNLVDVANGRVTAVALHREDSFEVGQAVWAPDGRSFFFEATVRENGSRFLVLIRHDLETSHDTEVFRHPRAWRMTWAVSPDGERIAFVENAAAGALRLLVAPLGGGEPSEVATIERPSSHSHEVGLAWTPNGRYILFGQSAGAAESSGDNAVEVWRVPASGGRAEPTGLVKEGLRHLTVTADGRGLLFSAGHQVFHQVWVLENLLPRRQASR